MARCCDFTGGPISDVQDRLPGPSCGFIPFWLNTNFFWGGRFPVGPCLSHFHSSPAHVPMDVMTDLVLGLTSVGCRSRWHIENSLVSLKQSTLGAANKSMGPLAGSLGLWTSSFRHTHTCVHSCPLRNPNSAHFRRACARCYWKPTAFAAID